MSRSLLYLKLSDGNMEYEGIIRRDSVTFEERVPCGVKQVNITDILNSDTSVVSKIIGDPIRVNVIDIIIVTSCDGSSKNYSVLIQSESCDATISGSSISGG